MKFRFHVVGLPHSQFHLRHSSCAFSTKLYNFCCMMVKAGHTVFAYGVEGGDVPCNEHIQVMSLTEQANIYGEHDFEKPYAATFDANHRGWQIVNFRGAAEIALRAEERDFICIAGGHASKPLVDALNPLTACEIGVGHLGSFSKHRVFESHAGLASQHRIEHPDSLDVSDYWTVIPTPFITDAFPLCPLPEENTYGFLGRIIHQKGVNKAVDACNHLGAKLLVAGPGAKMVNGELHGDDRMVYRGNIEHMGHVDQARKIEFFRRIKALLVPTIYLEPFGYVAAEAQLCGVPVISSNHGGFVDSVEPSKTGYRCQVLRQYIKAAQNVDKLDRNYIRERARRLWSLEAIAPRYEEYFSMLHDLWDGGWYETKNLEETNLNWIVDG